MEKTILIFVAKPSSMTFGGNDVFILELVKNWTSSEDRLILTINASHPCRDLFERELSSRAQIECLKEPMVVERRMAIAAKTAGHPWIRAGLEFLDDLARPFQAIGGIGRIARVIKKIRPDAALVNVGGNPPEDLGWRLLIALWLCRVPRVFLVNHIYPGHATNPLRAAVLAVLRKSTRLFCDLLVTPSRDCGLENARSMGLHIEPVCILHGIDPTPPYTTSLEAKRLALGLTGGPVIGAVANFEERKGLHVLVDAMPALLKRFPNVQLVLIGAPTDPVYAARVAQQIQTLGLEKHVKNAGYQAQAGQYFECFDVCIVPSIHSESFGIVALEAMRYKKPIVAAATGGLKEVIADGETGYLVPARDANALGAAIAKLLESPDLRQRMSQKAYERFMACFTTRIMATQYYKLTHGEALA